MYKDQVNYYDQLRRRRRRPKDNYAVRCKRCGSQLSKFSDEWMLCLRCNFGVRIGAPAYFTPRPDTPGVPGPTI